MSAESNDRWGGCNCDQCVADRAAVAHVLAAFDVNRAGQETNVVSGGHATDQHLEGLQAKQEEKK